MVDIATKKKKIRKAPMLEDMAHLFIRDILNEERHTQELMTRNRSKCSSLVEISNILSFPGINKFRTTVKNN